MAKQSFIDHSSEDIAVLQVGTCDVENYTLGLSPCIGIKSCVDANSVHTVYSVSGLSIDKAGEMAKQSFIDHSSEDIAVLQVGTCDVENYLVPCGKM